MRITASARIKNQAWRYDPATGFLRCTAAILKPGVMEYLRSELEGADLPQWVGEKARLYVPPEELAAPESVATLEGMPAVVGHVWQTAGNVSSCGNIAGAPRIESGHLMADILITDPAAVRRVMLPDGSPDKLEEISSAGDWSIIWQPGESGDGEQYDGYFVKLRYNHVALLPAGAGRAGASVRIINEKEGITVSEYTRVKLANGATVRVLNEDVKALEDADSASSEKVKNAVSAQELQKVLDELTALKAEVGDKNARIAELEGVVKTYKEQLESALSPEVVEEAAMEMANERDEAAKVMNAAGLQLSAEDRKLRGHGLRLKVVNSVRVKNGKAELGADEAKDEAFVRGVYKAHAELCVAPAKVTGANVVVNNANLANNQPNMANSHDRFQRMYGKTGGAQ